MMSANELLNQRPDRFVLIARAIAAGAGQLMPGGFEVWESSGDIAISVPVVGCIGVFGVRSALMQLPVAVTLHDVAHNAAGLLDWLQDLASEHLREVWPPAEGLAAGHSPCYRVEAQNGGIKFWFEADGVPVTRMIEVPIDL
jgi:hypothetical protein